MIGDEKLIGLCSSNAELCILSFSVRAYSARGREWNDATRTWRLGGWEALVWYSVEWVSCSSRTGDEEFCGAPLKRSGMRRISLSCGMNRCSKSWIASRKLRTI